MVLSIFKNSKSSLEKDFPTSTPMNPRIENRRQEIIKKKKTTRRRIIFGFLVFLGAIVMAISLLYSPWFRLNKLQIHSPNNQQVRAALAADPSLKGNPLLINISSKEISSRLKNMTWVKSVKVVKSWPSGLNIWVKPRVVVAKMQIGKTSWALLDQKGRVITTSKMAYPSLISIGTISNSATPGKFISTKFTPLLKFISKIPPSFRQSFSSIYFGPNGGIRLHLAHSKTVVVFGGLTQIDSKFISLRTILKKVPLSGVSMIDVSVAQRPTLTRG